MTAALAAEIVLELPKLRRVALHLCRYDHDVAGDLVQETACRALAHLDQFVPGSSMSAWLYVIMRNLHYSNHRKAREVRDEDGCHAARLFYKAGQDDHLHFLEVDAALARLVPAHAEALLLVAAGGMEYAEAARLSGCAEGTIKSRLNRAREKLLLACG